MFIISAGDNLFFFEPSNEVKNSYSVQEFRPFGKLHSVHDTPALIDYDNLRMEWRKDGKLHRDNGPAVIVFNKSGDVKERIFYKNDKVVKSGGGEDNIKLIKLKSFDDCIKVTSVNLNFDENKVRDSVYLNRNRLSLKKKLIVTRRN